MKKKIPTPVCSETGDFCKEEPKNESSSPAPAIKAAKKKEKARDKKQKGHASGEKTEDARETAKEGMHEDPPRLLLVIGTRPEAIKMAPLLPALHEAGLVPLLLTTGQHGRLLARTMKVLGMKADIRLPYRRNGSLPARAGEWIARLGEELTAHSPRAVLVHGDTLSAYAAATAAFLLGLPVVHIEAGLRTHDLAAPYPEEFCRRAIDMIASVLYAPTEEARDNLLSEGREASSLLVTGNTGLDALAYTVRDDFQHPLLRRARGRRLILSTLHRRESGGETLRGLLSALRRVADTFPDTFLVFAYHPNPAVADPVRELLSHHARIALLASPPPSVFHNLLARAYLVMTDSGGIQEEAAFLGRPTLVLREKTERGEGVAAGGLSLVGTSPEAVFRAAARVITKNSLHAAMAAAPNPFGDGAASPRIAADLATRIGGGEL